jgi:hypothetical protein
MPARIQLGNEHRHFAGSLGAQHVGLVQCSTQLALRWTICTRMQAAWLQLDATIG